MAADHQPPDDGSRNVENLLALGVVVLLIAAGIWRVTTMAEIRRVQDCAAQGRRNCATIEVPDRIR